MRLKSFYAKTMTEAMQMVRDTLGEEAVIVATREENGGKTVMVTAAVDPAFEIGQSRAAVPADDWLQYDQEEDELAIAEELTDTMLRHNVPEDVMDHILSCATVVGLENPRIAMIAAIEHLFHFRPLPLAQTRKAILLAGPPGAGKTLSVAKIAARGTMNGIRVGVVSADTVRAGGVEQLAALTRLLKTELKKAHDPASLAAAINSLSHCDQIIIDTPGLNPFVPEEVKIIARLIGAHDIEPYLVLPAGLDAQESGEIAKVFSTIGAQALIPTRVDVARRIGGLLAAAYQGHMSFADAGNTARVADGFVSLNPKSLSALLMPEANKDKMFTRDERQKRSYA